MRRRGNVHGFGQNGKGRDIGERLPDRAGRIGGLRAASARSPAGDHIDRRGRMDFGQIPPQRLARFQNRDDVKCPFPLDVVSHLAVLVGDDFGDEVPFGVFDLQGRVGNGAAASSLRVARIWWRSRISLNGESAAVFAELDVAVELPLGMRR